MAKPGGGLKSFIIGVIRMVKTRIAFQYDRFNRNKKPPKKEVFCFIEM